MSGAGLSLDNFKIGVIVSLITQPFEVIRTSSIVGMRDANKGALGIFQVIKQIFKMEGLRGFFRGGLIGIGRSALGSGIFFNGVENFHVLTKGLRDNKYIPNNLIDFVNACMTRFILTVINNPITVLKTKFEVVGNNEYKGIIQAIRHIYQIDGIRGFYKGMMTTLMRDVPWSGLSYASYKFGIDLYIQTTGKKPKDSPLAVSLIGGASASFAVIATYPFDNLRVRYQCHDLAKHHFDKPFDLLKIIYKEEGIRGFYVGLLPRLLKKGTSNALTWGIYETIRKDSIIHKH
jgi:Mitochondrial carrier protein.